jgi:ABC-type nitrate/sulfonate/bicarbonate transport system substrate-binding protein
VTITRRAACAFIGRSLLLGEMGAAFRSAPARATPAPLGTVDFQLNWLETVQFAGSYVAQSRGYYQARGVTVELLPGGPNVAVPPLIVAGKALIGLSTVSTIAQARRNGAPLKIIAACLQQSPEVVLSLAAKPIKSPRELIGKRLGVTSADLVDAQAFLHINHIDQSSVQIVPVQFDPAPLVVGEIDALFGFATDEAITLALRGVPVYSLRLEDFRDSGLFQVYVVHERSLADRPSRAKLAAFLAAERLGWRDALRDPDLAARLVVERYGVDLGLTLKQQQLQSRATDALIVSDDTRKHGLLWMSDAKMAQALAVLSSSGMSMRAQDMFDRSILDGLSQGIGA